ncbi:Integrase core domain-containing protein [Streptomyces sp. DvalAA-14]|nr:Integrase core domain-containing protein [Streptomyces sp. DvalAA-14]
MYDLVDLGGTAALTVSQPLMVVSGQATAPDADRPAGRMAGLMGRVGAPADNAAMESFFGLPRKNVLDRRQWTTRQELRIAIVTWIERTYHRRR